VIPAANADEFIERLKNRINQDPDHEMLVFIHGYNIPFAVAAQRTAQIHYDLGFQGAPAFFSWPSGGRLLHYLGDEASSEWAAAHLRDFLDLLAARSGATRIHLIAHSMGNRPLLSALAEIGRRDRAQSMCGDAPAPRIFSQVVMAAPDLDTDMFTQLKDAMQNAAERVTIYASRKDRAVIGSVFLHRFKRLGVPSPPPPADPKIESIDASNASTGFLGHSYYGSSILWDVKRVLAQPQERAIDRCTIRKPESPSQYATFVRQIDPRQKPPGPILRAWLRITRKRKPEPIEGECKIRLAAISPPHVAASH
jgi:esterase/lipase superfamily enzyme